jgi:hypothetical protein
MPSVEAYDGKEVDCQKVFVGLNRQAVSLLLLQPVEIRHSQGYNKK